MVGVMVVLVVPAALAKSGKHDNPFQSFRKWMEMERANEETVFDDTELPKVCEGEDDDDKSSSDDDETSSKQYVSPVAKRMCIRPRRPIQPRPR